jgi:hypothetical protein
MVAAEFAAFDKQRAAQKSAEETTLVSPKQADRDPTATSVVSASNSPPRSASESELISEPISSLASPVVAPIETPEFKEGMATSQPEEESKAHQTQLLTVTPESTTSNYGYGNTSQVPAARSAPVLNYQPQYVSVAHSTQMTIEPQSHMSAGKKFSPFSMSLTKRKCQDVLL